MQYLLILYLATQTFFFFMTSATGSSFYKLEKGSLQADVLLYPLHFPAPLWKYYQAFWFKKCSLMNFLLLNLYLIPSNHFLSNFTVATFLNFSRTPWSRDSISGITFSWQKVALYHTCSTHLPLKWQYSRTDLFTKHPSCRQLNKTSKVFSVLLRLKLTISTV